MKWALLSLLVWSIGAAAATLEIREGYVREMPPGQSTSAAFMKLVNTGAEPIVIIAASSDSAGSAELHSHSQRDGAMRMDAVPRLEVPAHGQVALAPGGYHLMLINLRRSLHAGDQVGITLLDAQGKSYSAKLPVVNVLGGASQHHHH
jgi:copper(I)-binding protein